MIKPFCFESTKFPGLTMNRYGVVFDAGSRHVGDKMSGAVKREAIGEGCHLVADDDRDVGLVWQKPVPPEFCYEI